MTSFEPGGTERQMIELVRRLTPSRWTAHVACFRARGAWFGRVAEAAASVDGISGRELSHPLTRSGTPGRSPRWCRERRIAIVHTAELTANMFGLPAGALGRVPVRIANRREINPDKTPRQIAAQRAAYAFAHRVIANSQAAADRLRLERVPARKIAVVPNGLDCGPFRARRARAALPRVVVGREPAAGKGTRRADRRGADRAQPVSRRALRIRRAADPSSRGCSRAPKRWRCRHAVTFLGHQDDVSACLDANDIFVLPSRSEAFPNAVLEAMAAGLPIVASRVGGILELVDDGHTGLLVPPDDPACARGSASAG